MGSCVLGHASPLPPGPWDETALWVGNGRSAAVDGKPVQIVSSGAGYHRVGTNRSWAFIRAGRYTRRPFQADQLHVDLWWRGVNLTRDAGTYLYNGQSPWDNGLAGTAVHNTVMVDQRDQMRRAGRFLWLDWAQASGKTFPSADGTFADRFQGEHEGYRNIGVKHQRIVQCVTEDAWIIVDDLLGTGAHDLRMHWLLPDFPVEVFTDSPFRADLVIAKTRFRWNVFSASPGITGIMRAGEKLAGAPVSSDETRLGWESPTYGELCPAISLLHCVRTSLPTRIVTVILANDDLQLSQKDGELVLFHGTSQVYQVSLHPLQSQNPVASRRTIAGAFHL